MRECTHGRDHWQQCGDCLSEMEMQLTIARSYLTEISQGKFNDDGVMKDPIAEPVRGRTYQQIAATGLAAIS